MSDGILCENFVVGKISQESLNPDEMLVMKIVEPPYLSWDCAETEVNPEITDKFELAKCLNGIYGNNQKIWFPSQVTPVG